MVVKFCYYFHYSKLSWFKLNNNKSLILFFLVLIEKRWSIIIILYQDVKRCSRSLRRTRRIYIILNFGIRNKACGAKRTCQENKLGQNFSMLLFEQRTRRRLKKRENSRFLYKARRTFRTSCCLVEKLYDFNLSYTSY